MKEYEKLISTTHFGEEEQTEQSREELDEQVEAEEFFYDLIARANRIKTTEPEETENNPKTSEKLSQEEYNELKSFQLGLIEVAEFDAENESFVYNDNNKRLEKSQEINETEDAKLPVNIIKLSEYNAEIVRDIYPATIFDIKVRKNSSGLYLRLHLVLEANKFNLEFQYKIYSKEYGDLTNFLIEKLGIKFNHKRTEQLSTLKYKKIYVEFEKCENSEYFEIFDFRQDKQSHHEKRINQKNIELAENSSYVFRNDEISTNLKIEGTASYQDVITSNSSNKKLYEGYIASVKFFSLQKKDGSSYSGVRLICHLLINNSITEVFKEMPAQLNSTSELSELLLRMGVPLFNMKTAIDINSQLKDRPILATLTKVDKSIWEINKIFPKEVAPKQKGEVTNAN